MTRPVEIENLPEEKGAGASPAVQPWQINRLAKRPTRCPPDGGVLEHRAGNKTRGSGHAGPSWRVTVPICGARAITASPGLCARRRTSAAARTDAKHLK
ncbi:unnamed protein product [Pleuronectes platessa]|uniref:Uncharacterized protein n=1 Tax=Pleuronectes platessa TaxID=8262 RepID=A0A9N7YQE9_PLEPL|nr:unnamed protein product [Pleuronectes platessa]